MREICQIGQPFQQEREEEAPLAEWAPGATVKPPGGRARPGGDADRATAGLVETQPERRAKVELRLGPGGYPVSEECSAPCPARGETPLVLVVVGPVLPGDKGEQALSRAPGDWSALVDGQSTVVLAVVAYQPAGDRVQAAPSARVVRPAVAVRRDRAGRRALEEGRPERAASRGLEEAQDPAAELHRLAPIPDKFAMNSLLQTMLAIVSATSTSSTLPRIGLPPSVIRGSTPLEVSS